MIDGEGDVTIRQPDDRGQAGTHMQGREDCMTGTLLVTTGAQG